ncbi:TetR family transcriptional regulator [Aestuariivirga litoralis]|uniref:TetR family transcriptional regulator n=1 Tax=Aestuariivirga litoralis TaxID=2650924 RepID=A0A2W2ARW6_9HYPH|nr:TetR/AcrR family transcriptional regulator [Aestuariivirga litoralis]PZF76372.1 TetR family transcriptional regulator [Aestuariivirga litoralis]
MTNQSVTTGGSRRPQARPSEILAAALELFAEKGFSATRMDDVAARAGLSKAGVYLYFKDKTALLKALVNELAGANIAVARGIVEAHQGPVSPLVATILAFLATQVRHTRFPELIKIVIAESRAHPDVGQLYLDTVINQGLPLFEGLIRRGIASGEFRAVDPALAARLMIGPMLLAIIWKTVFEPIGAEALDIEAYAAQHADIFLRGIRS